MRPRGGRDGLIASQRVEMKNFILKIYLCVNGTFLETNYLIENIYLE